MRSTDFYVLNFPAKFPPNVMLVIYDDFVKWHGTKIALLHKAMVTKNG